MIKNYFKLLRIPQWIKNFFVFVPLVFSQHLFEINYFLLALAGFAIFCLASSTVYVINDVMDVELDKVHLVKKFRPIASGKISSRDALITAFVLILILGAALTCFRSGFAVAVLSYFVLNIFYSFSFKHIVLLDIFSIAAGFMLRVVAGGLIIDVAISSWLLLTTMFISLFLAVIKRQSELKLNNEDTNPVTRKVLSLYSMDFTNQIATVTASGVIICYAIYTVSARTVSIFGTENLIYTTPFVVFGIFRYMYLVYISNKGENTTEIMLTDLPMILNILLYILIVTLIIYKII
ncbi:MAG: decaprenyl-phosphate phosphoribosyltransferase [Ignavibacteriaceae bacterium]|jgi:4-hydroxybenzoate polyprenyltransferase